MADEEYLQLEKSILHFLLLLFVSFLFILFIRAHLSLLGDLVYIPPYYQLLVYRLDNIFQPLDVIVVFSYYTKIVLIRSDDSAKVRYKPERYPEVYSEALQSFIRIEQSSFSYKVDLRRLEAAKDDSVLVSQYIFGSVKTQPIGIF